MPTPHATTLDTAEQLRQRARGLRQLARQLSGSRMASLATLAGGDTWVGPSPDRCAADLGRLRREVQAGADRLLLAAQRLERQAADVSALVDPARAR